MTIDYYQRKPLIISYRSKRHPRGPRTTRDQPHGVITYSAGHTADLSMSWHMLQTLCFFTWYYNTCCLENIKFLWPFLREKTRKTDERKYPNISFLFPDVGKSVSKLAGMKFLWDKKNRISRKRTRKKWELKGRARVSLGRRIPSLFNTFSILIQEAMLGVNFWPMTVVAADHLLTLKMKKSCL